MYTVIMPAGPQATYTLEAISSIYAQTLPPARVCVMVNGTSQHDWSHYSDVHRRYPDVELKACQRVGMVSAINAGIELTTTDFIAFLDTDDLWDPGKQSRQIEVLLADPELDAAYGYATNFRTSSTGERILLGTASAKTFTNTTFRTRAFATFGSLDPDSSHFNWLYRWWARADDAGIRSSGLDSMDLWRRIHDDNSWVVDNEVAKRTLLGELRRVIHKREDTA